MARLLPRLAGRARRCHLLLAVILAWPLAAFAADLPLAQDLAADARIMRQQRVPMLVLFSRDHCDWCDRARRQFLAPLGRDPAMAGRLLLRQIDLDRDTPLTDFSGRAATHREFAGERQARFAPTLMVLGPDGQPLAEPIVGFRLPDFYGVFIERAVDAGLARLRAETP